MVRVLLENDTGRLATNETPSKLSNRDDAQFTAQSRLDCYVVIVSSSDSKARRRPFLSLHSAERAIERAEQRGHTATLHLCRLVPVTANVERVAAW